MCPMVELFTYCINKQYVEGVQNGKKVYLTNVNNIDNLVSWLGSETISLLFKEQRQKKR